MADYLAATKGFNVNADIDFEVVARTQICHCFGS
jgi:hypothetical protein